MAKVYHPLREFFHRASYGRVIPMGEPFTIDILKRMSRRSIGLHITEDGLLEVRAPYFAPLFVIRRFVESQRDWITYTRKKVLSTPKTIKPKYVEGAVFHLGGSPYTLHLTDGNSVVRAGTRIFFPKKFTKHPKPHMESFLRSYAKKYLAERMEHFARIMDVSYRHISIRDTRSRWGSCSSTGTISFAYRLLLAPKDVIDYVVIHELSHITHHHHRADFWERVGSFCPEYKAYRMWLQRNGHTLRV